MAADLPPGFDDDGSSEAVTESILQDGRLWREYEHLTSLYRFYLDLVVKVAVGTVFIVSTITTVVLVNAKDRPEIEWSLLALALLCAAVCWASVQSSRLACDLNKRVKQLASDLSLGLAPHVQLLIYGILGGAVLAGTAAVLLVALFVLLRLT